MFLINRILIQYLTQRKYPANRRGGRGLATKRSSQRKDVIKEGNRRIRRRIIYLFFDFNFYEFRKKPVLPPHPSHHRLNKSLVHTHRAFIYTKQWIHFLGAHESLASKLGDIFCHRALLLLYISFFIHIFSLVA
jgi:hypothetical protein